MPAIQREHIAAAVSRPEDDDGRIGQSRLELRILVDERRRRFDVVGIKGLETVRAAGDLLEY